MADILSTLRELRSLEQQRSRGPLSPENEARLQQLQAALAQKFPPIAAPPPAGPSKPGDPPFVDTQVAEEPTETRTGVLRGNSLPPVRRPTNVGAQPETPFKTPLPTPLTQLEPTESWETGAELTDSGSDSPTVEVEPEIERPAAPPPRVASGKVAPMGAAELAHWAAALGGSPKSPAAPPTAIPGRALPPQAAPGDFASDPTTVAPPEVAPFVEAESVAEPVAQPVFEEPPLGFRVAQPLPEPGAESPQLESAFSQGVAAPRPLAPIPLVPERTKTWDVAPEPVAPLPLVPEQTVAWQITPELADEAGAPPIPLTAAIPLAAPIPLTPTEGDGSPIQLVPSETVAWQLPPEYPEDPPAASDRFDDTGPLGQLPPSRAEFAPVDPFDETAPLGHLGRPAPVAEPEWAEPDVELGGLAEPAPDSAPLGDIPLADPFEPRFDRGNEGAFSSPLAPEETWAPGAGPEPSPHSNVDDLLAAAWSEAPGPAVLDGPLDVRAGDFSERTPATPLGTPLPREAFPQPSQPPSRSQAPISFASPLADPGPTVVGGGALSEPREPPAQVDLAQFEPTDPGLLGEAELTAYRAPRIGFASPLADPGPTVVGGGVEGVTRIEFPSADLDFGPGPADRNDSLPELPAVSAASEPFGRITGELSQDDAPALWGGQSPGVRSDVFAPVGTPLDHTGRLELPALAPEPPPAQGGPARGAPLPSGASREFSGAQQKTTQWTPAQLAEADLPLPSTARPPRPAPPAAAPPAVRHPPPASTARPARSKEPTAAALPTTTVRGEARVVVHTLDGVQRRGMLVDSDLNAEHVTFSAQLGAETLSTASLKAIFFVVPIGEPVPAPQGSPIVVTLIDGRQLTGLTPDYQAGAPGFFLCPTDQRSRTASIYIYAAAVRAIS